MDDNKNENESLWDSVDPNEDIKPKIVFPYNEMVKVTFPKEFTKPREFPSKHGNGFFCVLSVMHNGSQGAIVTSAYSLLGGLKKLMPLSEKTVVITKKLKDGKMNYEVKEVFKESDSTI